MVQEDINDIVDAFIKMRSRATLDEINKKRIEDILILFNQWIMMGKGQQEQLPWLQDIFSSPISEQQRASLEEEISLLEPSRTRPEHLYGTGEVHIVMRDVYSPKEVYGIAESAEFLIREDRFEQHNPYTSKAVYKTH